MTLNASPITRLLLLLAFCVLSLCPTLTIAANPPARPNIIFLFSDDHQADAMGCAGNAEIQTPHMDRLAQQGILFDRAYATSPLCMAARATVMTGMYEYKNGCNFETGDVSTADWLNLSYPILLKKSGYRTAFGGKWGFRTETPDYRDAFDVWAGFNHYDQGSYHTAQNPHWSAYAEKYPHLTRALGAFGRDFIRSSVKMKQPFCLSLSFKSPHRPHHIIDPADREKYKTTTFSPQPNQGAAENLPSQPKITRQRHEHTLWHPEETYQQHLRKYYQLISGLDAAIGMVIDEVAAQGIADNTIIIYTSDNGYFCGSRGLAGKVLPYERSVRIPLIVVAPQTPKAQRGAVSHQIIGNIDFAPTILDFAGIARPDRMDGHSLRPLLITPSPTTPHRQALTLVQNWGWSQDDLSRGLSIVTPRWKYIYWAYGDNHIAPAEELFDLANDRHETTNLVNNTAHQATRDQMRVHYDQALEHWRQNAADHPRYNDKKQMFDRNIPWQQKTYHGPRINHQRKLYQSVTGQPYPKASKTKKPKAKKTP